MRLNVTALLHEEVAGKFLVVVEEEAGMDHLVAKLQRTFKAGGIEAGIERVLNGCKAAMPHDEFLGDMLRDGEDIFVVLRGQNGQLLRRRPLPADMAPVARSPASPMAEAIVQAPGSFLQPAKVQLTIPPEACQDEGESDDEVVLQEEPNAAYWDRTRGQANLKERMQALRVELIRALRCGSGNGKKTLQELAHDPGVRERKAGLPKAQSLLDFVRLFPNNFAILSDGVDTTVQLISTDVLQILFEPSPDVTVPAAPTPAAYPPAPVERRAPLGGVQAVPGPQENFEEAQLPGFCDTLEVDHPADPIQPTTYDNDWLVESLTPKVREFVLKSFREDLITEPQYVPSIGKFVGPRFYQKSGCFVSLFMRPQTQLGSDPNSTMPVHYNIAKHDLLIFQRKAEAHIEKARQHLDLFGQTLRGLKALLTKGMSESDHISVMLPHSYQAFDEVEGMMHEVERPLFPKLDGQNPIIILDTSGAVGRHLTFVKAAMKRALHAHMAGKVTFQMIRFAPATGEPRMWQQGLVPVSDESLIAAEEWIDSLTPATSARLVNAVRYATAHQDADVIYLLSSGEMDSSQHDAVLTGIRGVNVCEVPINTVGVDAEPLGELLLRNISESNHGDFLLKRFDDPATGGAYCKEDARWTSWRTNLVNEKNKQLSDSFKKQKMSIGSQVKIIEVMQREEKQKEVAWCEEWKCIQRLFLSSEASTNSVNRDRDMVKELERKASRTSRARTGGGFMYQTDEVNLGLEQLFEHKSAVPWTANSDTVATGPKFPNFESGQGRMAKFPPGPDDLPDAISVPSERRVRPRSASSAGGKSQRRLTGPAVVEKSNPWASGPYADRARKVAPTGQGQRKVTPGSGAGVRTASADRAAGDRAPSPSSARSTFSARKRSKSPGSARERLAPREASRPGASTFSGVGAAVVSSAAPAAAAPLLAPPAAAMGRLRQRRWSF